MPSSQGNKLDQYSIAARGQMRVGHKAASWAGFATAAGASLAMSGVAEATIIYSGTQNIDRSLATPNASSTFNDYSIDIDNDGTKDVVITLQHFTSNALPNNTFTTTERLGGGVVLASAQGAAPTSTLAQFSVNGASSSVRQLSFGQTIGPAGNFGGAVSAIAQGDFTFASVVSGSVIGATTALPGPWALSSTGFVGVQFQHGGNNHYAWIRLHFTDNSGNNQADEFRVIDWAWESDAGVGIAAGAPEPTPLALLAAGAVGIGSFRRKRKATAA
jgi:hypothetical protein